MNCPNCGDPLEKDARSCPNCFARIDPNSIATWRGMGVRVRARLVPRYLWTSASIDVYVDGERVFGTGGKIQSVGSHAERVKMGGAEHEVEVSWGRSQNFRFPYQLKIDGDLVAESRVAVENQVLMLVPSTLIIAVLVSLAFGVIWCLEHLLPQTGGN